MYLDTAYVAKCYLNEPDSDAVRALVQGVTGLTSSALCRAEMACVLHRHVRESNLTKRQAARLHALFLGDVRRGIWFLQPVSSDILLQVEASVMALRKEVPIRAADAVHLVSARSAGFRDIWTNDRHMLAAARRFGLRGRSA